MKKQQVHQLELFFDEKIVPISIPEETRSNVVDITGELLSDFWANCNEIIEQKEEKHDK